MILQYFSPFVGKICSRSIHSSTQLLFSSSRLVNKPQERYFQTSRATLARRNARSVGNRERRNIIASNASLVRKSNIKSKTKSYDHIATLKAAEKELEELEFDEEDGHEVDEDEEFDEETNEFLEEIDEIFALEPSEFEKRMENYEKRQGNEHVDEDDYEEDSLRVKELIPRKRLLKVLEEVEESKKPTLLLRKGEKPSTPKTKHMAPLDKKEKPQIKEDKISYRQERVEMAIFEFIQTLLLQDRDLYSETNSVFPNVIDVSVSPDLRRAILFWEPARLHAKEAPISKRKIEGVQNKLQRQEKWIRVMVTRHLNLKYSPIIQFKIRKSMSKSDKNRHFFEKEMKWLDRI